MRTSLFVFITLCLCCTFGAFAQYTIYNGHLEGNHAGWDGIVVDGRENGGFGGSTAYQAINSSFDTSYPSSGSVLFTASSSACSLTQQLNFTASGQVYSISADIAWDGTWTNFFFGFYEENLWDRMTDCSFEITSSDVPSDTDGTLDSFTRVSIRDVTMSSSGNPVRVFFGTSCSPGFGGAPVGSKIAVDNVTPTYDPSAILLNRGSSVDEWYSY